MLDGDRSFEELPTGAVLLREEDAELFEKSSATEITSFFFTGTGLRYANDEPTLWEGIATRWDWVVLTPDQVDQARQSAVVTEPLRIPWGLIVAAAIVVAVICICSGR